jgi:uncharacterized membrane protein
MVSTEELGTNREEEISSEDDTSQYEKPWWQSRVIIGAFLVLVSQVAKLAGFEIDSEALLPIVLELMALVGGALALWGRVNIKKRLVFKKKVR